MKIIKRPEPINEEVVLSSDKVLLSKTNPKGIIEYANDSFIEISGYNEPELIGQPHNVIRHPDMPKVIFKCLWEHLNTQKNIHALIKNLTKEGKYYWVVTSFEIKINEQGEINSFLARRKKPPHGSVEIINNLYKKLLAIEKASGVDFSEKYLIGFLEEKNMTYNDYIEKICIPKEENKEENKEEITKSLFERFFFSEF